MSTKFNSLTLDQIEQISAHFDQWKNISLSTDRVNKDRAEYVVNSVYKMLGYDLPKILFFDSPYAACNLIAAKTNRQLNELFGKQGKLDYELHKGVQLFIKQIYSQIDIKEIYVQLKQLASAQQLDLLRGGIGVWEGIDYQIGNRIWQLFDESSLEKIGMYFGHKLYRYYMPGKIIDWNICNLDYFVSTFDLVIEKEHWELYKSLSKLGNYVFLQEKACIICDRPTKMSFDGDAFLHAEGEPAIQFADGYCLYSYHLTTLPQKYGKVHPKDWQPKWLLTETDLLVREALIKGIGYAKIRHELSIKQIDYWHNFMLLVIEIPSNSDLVFLLEININTAEIERVKEVAQDVQSVMEAASFVENYEDWDFTLAESKGLEMPF